MISRDFTALENRIPFGKCQFVSMTFGDADEDLAIRHQLPPGRYRDVAYLVVKKDRACDIYTGSKSPEPSALYLRSSVADATVTLLLFLPRDADV
jgi:hypothetical protein